MLERAPGRTEHLGIDIHAVEGTRMTAIADSTLRAGRPLLGANWGTVVVVEHRSIAGPFTVEYGHVTTGSRTGTLRAWQAGDLIRRGKIVGTVKSTGRDRTCTSVSPAAPGPT